jgi:hypothetical protein
VKLRFLLAATILAASGNGVAQAPQVVADMAGMWQLVPVDGRPACGIELTSLKAAEESWLARPSPACAKTVVAAGQVTRWRYEDGVQLLDDQDSRHLTFVEDETTLLASPDLANPAYYLIPSIPGLNRLPQATEMPGGWSLRQGEVVCSVQLRSNFNGSSGTRILMPSRGCTGIAARLNHWWLEGMTLLLAGPNDLLLRLQITGDWRFEQASDDRDVGKGWTLVRTSPIER